MTIVVTLQRDVDEDDDNDSNALGKVISARYPTEKQEGWWLVVGDSNANSLLSVKRLTLEKRSKVNKLILKLFLKLILSFYHYYSG